MLSQIKVTVTKKKNEGKITDYVIDLETINTHSKADLLELIDIIKGYASQNIFKPINKKQ